MKNLTEITRSEIESVTLSEYDLTSLFPKEKLVEDILSQLNLEYCKNSASTGSVYYHISRTEDETMKLRLANHSKSNYSGREVDSEIIYNEDTTESDIYNEIYQILI